MDPARGRQPAVQQISALEFDEAKETMESKWSKVKNLDDLFNLACLFCPSSLRDVADFELWAWLAHTDNLGRTDREWS